MACNWWPEKNVGYNHMTPLSDSLYILYLSFVVQCGEEEVTCRVPTLLGMPRTIMLVPRILISRTTLKSVQGRMDFIWPTFGIGK